MAVVGLAQSLDPSALVPGSSAVWHELATKCRDRVSQATDRAGVLSRLNWSEGLAGSTYDAVVEKTSEACKVALRAGDAYGSAGDAVEGYAYALEAAHSQAGDAADLYREGQEASRAAWAQYQVEQSRQGHVPVFITPGAPGLQAPFVDPGAAKRAEAEDYLDHARSMLGEAEDRAILTLEQARDLAVGASLWDGLAPVPRTRDGMPWSPADDYELGAGRDAINEAINVARDGPDSVPFRVALVGLVEGLEAGRYDPAEITAVIANLNDRDAKLFNDGLEAAKHRSRSASFPSRFSSSILAGASNAEEVKALTEKLAALEPTPKPGSFDGWMTPGKIDVKNIDHEDIHQGFLGDCWLLSGLGAQAAADPSAIANSIRENPNGTFTVTMFKEGIATDVTVSADMPSRNGGLAFAGPETGIRDPNWVSVYEKAAAQLIGEGQYARIESGIGASGISVVSGPAASTYGPFSAPGQPYLSFEDLKSMVESKRPIVPMTGLPWNDPTIAERHAYYVAGVTDDSRIIVRNPWGKGSDTGKREMLILTEEQFNKKFITAGAGD